MYLDRESMRALIVADDKGVVRDATRLVRAHCVYLETNPDPVAALEVARSKVFDVVLFDSQLLRAEFEAAFALFRAMSRLCCVALTRTPDASERIRWLEAGADDCISIPCDPAELLARIRATVRCAHRAHDRSPRTLQVGRLRLSLETMHAEIDGNRLDLTVYEFALLWVFASNSGKVLSREEILALARGSTADAFERSIDVQVSRLRNKLGDNPRRPRFLKTVRGTGYLLVPDTWE